MAESNSRMDDEKPGIPLQPVKGMRDILGKPARVKRWVEQIIYQKALQYGFEPMQVPVIEYYDLLAAKGGAGDAVQKEMFRLEDQSKRQLGLRFEFTTSLARVVIGNPDLPKPIKSFNLGTVYRYENPQAFRYREFTQGDVDIIGSPFPEADAECLSFAIDTMRALGFEDFSIRLNDRRIMNELMSMNGIPPSRTTEAMRILDKWDKLGQEGVRKELQAAELPITILTYLNDALEKTKNDVKTSAIATQGIMALETIMALLGAQGKDEYVTYDPSLVRGMDYYTGSVFEIQAGITASVGGGGRYDTLIQYFGGPSLPAVGISFGVDRLVDILAETFEETRVEVYVIPIGDTLPTCLNVIDRLRAYGLRVEIDLMRRGISKNMNYANSQGIPVVLILGEDETANGGITLRDMTSGEETLIPLDEKGKLEKEIERRILK